MPRHETEHGTNRGYHWHYRRKEPACKPCREAHNVYVQRRRNPDWQPRKPLPCGTAAAYKRHLIERTVPCLPCTDAARDYKRELRRRRELQDVAAELAVQPAIGGDERPAVLGAVDRVGDPLLVTGVIGASLADDAA